jgi:Ribbon-helix-helix protein, copG family
MPEYQRLSVNINDESAEIIRRVKRERGINTTEAIRRAIGLLGFFEEARKSDSKVLLEDSEGQTSTVKFV